MECLEYSPDVEYPEGMIDKIIVGSTDVEILPVNVKSVFDKFQKEGFYYKNFLKENKEDMKISDRILLLKNEVSDLQHLIDTHQTEQITADNEKTEVEYSTQLAQIHSEINEMEKKLRRPNKKVLTSVSEILAELEKQSSFHSPQSETKVEYEKSLKVKSNSTKSQLVYELRLDIDKSSQNLTNIKTLDLFQKLDKIEKYIGPFDAYLFSQFPVPYESSTIQEIVGKFREIAALTDVETLSAIETRINLVLQLLQKMESKKNSLPNLELKTEVQELYEIVDSYRYLKPKLISMNDRLRSIERVTTRSSSLLSYLDSIEKDLKLAELRVASQSETLQQLNETMSQNVTNFKENFEIISEKIRTLELV